MEKEITPGCAKCPVVVCRPQIKVNEEPALNKAPNYCPMKNMPEIIEKAMAEYAKPEVREFARLASI